MKISINPKLFYQFLIVVILTVIGINSHNTIVALLCAMVQVVMICINARFSYLSLFSFIINYCLFPELIAYNNGVVFGLLGHGNIKIYYFELCFCCYIINLVIFSLIAFTRFVQDEKKIFEIDYNFSNVAVVSLSIVAVLLTLLIFPSIPGFNIENRFKGGFLSISGWSCVPFFLLSLGLLSKKKKKVTYFATGIVCFWYVLHGERVDVIGMLFFFVMMYFNSQKRSKKQVIGLAMLGVAAMIVLSAVGFWRDGNVISLRQLIAGTLIQSTACDVTNVFNAAVDTFYRGNLFYGDTYLSYLINCIPMLPDNYSFQFMIRKEYQTAGGGLFFAEPIANFGFGFLVIEIIVYFYVIRSLIRRTTAYRSLVYAELCLSIFRTAWYGLNYPIVTILYFVPAVIIYNKYTYKMGKKDNC